MQGSSQKVPGARRWVQVQAPDISPGPSDLQVHRPRHQDGMASLPSLRNSEGDGGHSQQPNPAETQPLQGPIQPPLAPLASGWGGLGSERFRPPVPARPRRKWPPPEQRGRRTMAIELGRGARARIGRQLPALIRTSSAAPGLRGLPGREPPLERAAGGQWGPIRERTGSVPPPPAGPHPRPSTPAWGPAPRPAPRDSGAGIGPRPPA
ncbi:proline-rich protein HaeIII subfamily 1-like [Saccopteryx bilineata]|uniref:proline-rich protein HaeIII subfamily 1-like n=1 Tax=Saccopteryx bilineata TaxID=59482 RepID=UPI00338DD9A0